MNYGTGGPELDINLLYVFDYNKFVEIYKLFQKFCLKNLLFMV
jgi:hypothetical protein